MTKPEWSKLRFAFSEDGTKNHVQLLCFLPELPGVCSEILRGRGHHTKPMLCFLGFLSADANLESKILLGTSIVGFTIVCADTGSRSYQLRYQRRCYWGHWNSLGERDHVLPEN